MPARRSIALYSFIFFCSRADVDHSVLNPVDKYYYVESGGGSNAPAIRRL
jgi:hypothetical protein